LGLRPEEFWSMTFWEYANYSKYLRFEDERRWWHTSSLMALHANLNRDSKKQPKAYKAEDFHPYASEPYQKAKFVRQLSDEERELTHSWAQKLNQKYG